MADGATNTKSVLIPFHAWRTKLRCNLLAVEKIKTEIELRNDAEIAKAGYCNRYALIVRCRECADIGIAQ